MLLNVDLNPGCTWAKTYTVVSLERLLSGRRAARVCVRRVCDLVCPEGVTFPLKQRLALHGAMLDSATPAPKIRSDGDGWDAEVEDGDDGDDPNLKDDFNGRQGENAERLVSDSVEMAMALDPMDHPDDQPPQMDVRDVREVDEDVEQLKQLHAEEGAELRQEGKSPPKGWRIDRFGERVVSVPPWSLRPRCAAGGLGGGTQSIPGSLA